MLLQLVVDETEETTSCEAGCGTTVNVDDGNYFSSAQNGCHHISGESGYYCDVCWPYCNCTEGNI